MAMKSESGKALLGDLRLSVISCLRAVDGLDFATSESVLIEARGIVGKWQIEHAPTQESVLNDLAVLNYYLVFFEDYSKFWKKIVEMEYEASWNALQDTYDSIRLIKRLSKIDLSRFENQLVDLEKTYPYKVFASIGAVAERIECSICGNDIDSSSCAHRRGELYMGKMAVGIIHGLKNFDHVALTERPEDKRCVMKVHGEDYQYPSVDWLALNLNARSFVISQFSHVEMTQRKRPNADYVRLGRNDSCFCGSEKKFKHCCIDKKHVTNPHAKFVLSGGRNVAAVSG